MLKKYEGPGTFATAFYRKMKVLPSRHVMATRDIRSTYAQVRNWSDQLFPSSARATTGNALFAQTTPLLRALAAVRGERLRHLVARLVPERVTAAGPRRKHGPGDQTPRPIYMVRCGLCAWMKLVRAPNCSYRRIVRPRFQQRCNGSCAVSARGGQAIECPAVALIAQGDTVLEGSPAA